LAPFRRNALQLNLLLYPGKLFNVI